MGWEKFVRYFKPEQQPPQIEFEGINCFLGCYGGLHHQYEFEKKGQKSVICPSLHISSCGMENGKIATDFGSFYVYIMKYPVNIVFMIDAHFSVKCVKFNKRDNSKYKNTWSVNQLEPVHAIHIKSGYTPSCESLDLAFIFCLKSDGSFFSSFERSLLYASENNTGTNEIISQVKDGFLYSINGIITIIGWRRQIWRTLVWLIVLNNDWKHRIGNV